MKALENYDLNGGVAAGIPEGCERAYAELLSGTDDAVRGVAAAVLASPFPMFLLLGDDLRLIYNSAYVPILGQHHPAAAGQPFFEVWPEVRDVIAPVIERAIAGEASMFEDMRVTLHRPDAEEAFFTFSYSPVRQRSGAAAGALCVCTETTEAVRARHRQAFLIELENSLRQYEDPFSIVEAAQEALGRHLGVSRVGYGSLDDNERFFTTDRNWTDGSVPNHNGTHDLTAFGPEIYASLRSGTSLAVEDTSSDPMARFPEAQAAFAALQVRSAATVSLIKNGRFVAAMYVHHHQPRRWSAEDVALVQDVAERTWSAVERAHAQADLLAFANRQSFLVRLGDALRDVANADEVKATASRLLGETLGVGRVGYGEIDAAQEHVTVERDWTDGTIASLAGETRHLDVFGPAIIAELRSGRTLRLNDVAEDPIAAQYAAGYQSIGVKSLLVVPLIKDQRFRAILYLHHATPRRWSDEDAATALDVAERTWAAVERARAEAALTELNQTLERRVADALAELRQAQKMEAMGQLTGGVAHDFNNLLTPIVGSLDMLQRKGLGSDRDQRLIGGALQSAERAKVLVQRLLAFARRQPLQPSAVDIGDLVRGMADLIASTAGPQIEIAVDVKDDLPPSRADRNQLELALLNLAVNARDAMPGGGTIRISADVGTVDDRRAHGLAPGRYVRMSVADTGVGMDSATLQRAVEPFFSTKGIGKGTGLGLSMVHGLASQLGGALALYSRPEIGTNVELWLPFVDADHADEDQEPATSVAGPRSGLALVVDDEELVRFSTAEMVRELGYDVIEAASGEEAQRRVAEGVRPSVLVTDHLMPGINGTDLARQLRATIPDLKVLVVSGYAEVEGIAPDLPRLTKPFRREELARSLAE